ncbi:MAG: hypothetical protein WC889_19820 [Myxococcota bacterium]|jgi:hypothetical protein
MQDNTGHGAARIPTVKIEYRSVNSFIADYLHSFRSGTAFITAPRPPKAGAKIRLRISAPGIERGFTIVSEVAWSKGAGEVAAEGSPQTAGMSMKLGGYGADDWNEFNAAARALIERSLGHRLSKKLLGEG